MWYPAGLSRSTDLAIPLAEDFLTPLTEAELRMCEVLTPQEMRQFENYMSYPKTLNDVQRSFSIGDLCKEELEVAVERILKAQEEKEEAA